MGHTLTEKIIAAHLVGGEGSVSPGRGVDVWPGDLVEVGVDLVLANDITAPIAIQEFEKLGVERVFDLDRIVLVPDHFTPNKDIKSAEQ